MGDFSTRDSHLIRDNVTVDVHRGSDVRVPHELLLHGNGGAHGVKPTSVGMPHRVGGDGTDASIYACFQERTPYGVEGPWLTATTYRCDSKTGCNMV
jgi:hypothetical protein